MNKEHAAERNLRILETQKQLAELVYGLETPQLKSCIKAANGTLPFSELKTLTTTEQDVALALVHLRRILVGRETP